MARSLFDRAPLGLPAPAAQRWEAFYRQAADLYGERYASHVATKLVYDLYSSSTGRARPRPTPGSLPHPGNHIGLGFTLELAGVRWGGTTIEKVLRIRADHCLWSQDLKAVLVFPRLRLTAPTRTAESLPRLLKLYRIWNDGKQPKVGGSKVKLPAATFRDVWAGAIIAYSSDKFDADGDYHTYVHHLEQGRRGETGPLIYISDECIMLRGGKLRLTRDGLAG